MPIVTPFACAGPAADADRRTPDAAHDTHADTDGDTDPTVLSASCEVQPDNVLRVDCAVHVDPPSAVTLTFAPVAGGPARTVDGATVAADHALTAWRMVQDTEYQWTAAVVGGTASASGTWTTGALPEAASVEVTVSGTPTRTEDVAVMMGCGANVSVVVLDPAGEVVWYQPLDAGLSGDTHTVTAIAWTTDDRVAAVVDRRFLRMFALDGALALEAEMGVTPGYDRFLHHDAFARDGYLFTLNAYVTDVSGTPYVTDGIYVMDGTTGEVLASWDVASFLTPTGPPNELGFWDWAWPGAIDWVHSNGLYVDEELEITLSLFQASTILRIAGDPADPAFGTVRFAMVGDPASPFTPTMAVDGGGVTTDTSFGHQHAPYVLPGGDLLFFDNTLAGPESRVLRMALDPAAGRATVTWSLPLGVYCPIEGTARPLANGHVLAHCSRLDAFLELDPSSGAVVATTTPACTGATLQHIHNPIAIPVTL